MKKLILALSATLGFGLQAHAELREYTLNITLNAQEDRILINNEAAAPILYANKGDDLRIVVNNNMDIDSSIHWHGVLLPNNQDGVPNITTDPIKAGGQLVYEYNVEQTGTYWYHSHSGLQEQQGLYGAIVFNDELQTQYGYTKDEVIMLSDSSASSVKEITDNLEKTGMHYGKAAAEDASGHGSSSSSHGNMSHGSSAEGGAMEKMSHAADIFYDNILINGKATAANITTEDAGQWTRLRVINAGASSYFKLSADAPMYIIAADGQAIEPVAVQAFKIVNGETYDILVQTQKEEKKINIEAIGQELTSSISLSAKNTTADMPAQAEFEKNPAQIAYLENVYELKALNKNEQNIAAAKDYKEIDFDLTGSMQPYQWSINEKIFDEAEPIMAKQDQILRIKFTNKTDMPHPMHLHGYFFNIVKADGSLSIPKHTVNVEPEETVIIEFNTADHLGKWMIHCHNLYHMKYGMMRMITVE